MSSYTGYLATRWLDDNKFQVLDPYRFDYGDKGSGVGIYVHKGKVTDLMSLPRIVRAWITRTTSGSIASVPHDIAYETGELMTYIVDPDNPDNPVPIAFGPSFKITRKKADQLFLDALLVRNVNRATAWTCYYGLRAGGWVRWNQLRRADKKDKR